MEHEMHSQQGHEMKRHDSGHGRHEGHASMIEDFKKRFWVSALLTIPILILSPMIQMFLGLGESLRFPGDLVILFMLSSIVYFYGGYPFLTGLWEEGQKQQIGMMTLIATAITSAYLYSAAIALGLLQGMDFFWELATLIDIMLLGHWIEMRSVLGASQALEALAALMPSDAHRVLPDGTVQDVPLAELQSGDRVLIKPGEKVPADGEVLSGETSLNESMLTGESRPVAKGPGGKVIGGSINGEGAVTVEVKHTGKESYLSQVIQLVKEAQESKSHTQDLANRAAQWLTFVALFGGGITLVIWWLFLRSDISFALERMVTVMVIACPHALGLAVPLVVAISTAISASNGLLIRDRVAFEQAKDIQAIIFDKTGTLTEGKFGVTETVVLGDLDKASILQLAASIEANSEHPIAKGIVESSPEHSQVEGFRAIPGKGAEGTVDGKRVKVVSPGFLREQNIRYSNEDIEPLALQGKTVVFVLVEDRVVGAIALADLIRPESKEAIARLKQMGIRTIMLTGDNTLVARWVADSIGIDEYFAEVLPQDKAKKVKEIQSRGLIVAMTGDGVNDAPALAQSNVGIAIGAGTDVAIETASIILVRSNPLDVVAIVDLAKATYGKMVQNLIWATGYNIIAIPLAAGVLYRYGILLTPALGAILMSASTVIVAFNARLLRLPNR